MLNIFVYFEWMACSLFYYFCCPKKYHRPLLIASLLVLFILGLGSFYFHSFYEYNVIGLFALKLFILSLSIRELYRYHLYSDGNYLYINLAFLFTTTINLVLFSFGNILSTLEADTQKLLWIINGLIFIGSLLLMAKEAQKATYGG
ncbi:hypothetical protein [Croceimicrobium hydrocarbonivorans]|uniref:Uncharacterized protein n=1 Tax=Croceimicrobium hydrocarbonivorans TaxID=2761580 RepID=A0A7H0VFQ2_9FLAO|nr:hypothetical protein [Croceimicrobium hydrocarbonivorans]QNR24550.1 hypothetical protein H4K34_01535 [Croceimicrobium hydrocarbonivorans]